MVAALLLALLAKNPISNLPVLLPFAFDDHYQCDDVDRNIKARDTVNFDLMAEEPPSRYSTRIPRDDLDIIKSKYVIRNYANKNRNTFSKKDLFDFIYLDDNTVTATQTVQDKIHHSQTLPPRSLIESCKQHVNGVHGAEPCEEAHTGGELLDIEHGAESGEYDDDLTEMEYVIDPSEQDNVQIISDEYNDRRPHHRVFNQYPNTKAKKGYSSELSRDQHSESKSPTDEEHPGRLGATNGRREWMVLNEKYPGMVRQHINTHRKPLVII